MVSIDVPAEYDPNDPTTETAYELNGNIYFSPDYTHYNVLAHELGHALGTKQTGDMSSARNFSYSEGIGEAEAILNEYKVLKAEQKANGGISQDTIMTNTDELDMQGDSLYNKIEQMKANGKSEDEILNYLAHENRHKMIPSGEIATYHQEDIWWYLENYSNIIKDYSEISSATLDITNPDIVKMIDYDLFGDDNDFDDVIDAKNSKNQLKTQSLNGSAFMYGGSGDDTLTGTDFADVILGGEGIDTLKGENGNDTLAGNANTDYLYGGEGDDTLKGGAGTDYLYGEIDNDSLYGGKGNDELYGGENNDTLIGETNQDKLYGGKDNDILVGGTAIFHDDGESDILQGGDGFDTYYADSYDIIEDSDGSGKVYLAVNNQDILLTGGSHKAPYKANIYKNKDGKITYEWDKDNNTLYVNEENSKEKLTINNWQNGELGINLGTGGDIAFVVDVSGSMDDDIASVQSQLNNIVNTIYDPSKDLIDTRIAVAGYEKQTTILQTFTEHENIADRKTAVSNAIDQMASMIDGGTEYLYHALLNVLSGDAGKWRADASFRSIYLIGDEPGDDRDIAQQVYKLAQDVGVNASISARSNNGYAVTFDDGERTPIEVNIHTIMIGDDSLTETVFKDIAKQTGGNSYYADGASDIADVLIDVIKDDLNTAPLLNDKLPEQLIISTEQNNWQYQPPTDLAIDKDDGDSLTYTWTLADGSDLPQGIGVNSSTGEIFNNKQPLQADDYELLLTITDQRGASVSTTTTLIVTDRAIQTADSESTVGSFADDFIVAELDDSHNILGLLGDDALFGGNQDDKLNGGAGNDDLRGLLGNDSLNGGFGNDTLIGGQGDDILNGGIGNDTYVYHKGDGKDSIFDWTGDDSLQLTDFSLSDLLVSKDGNDLLIDFKNSDEDSITISSVNTPLIGSLYVVESFVLADQTMNMQDVMGLV